MSVEIERKFLINEVPFEELQSAHSLNIMQGYVVLGEDSELRIRKKGNHYSITRKRGSGLVREESEEVINKDVFNIMWPFTEGRRVEKLRFTFNYKDHQCEIDIYSGELADLMVMEVEFDSEEDANAFVPPAFCTKEITEDKRFKNAILAKLGKPDIS